MSSTTKLTSPGPTGRSKRSPMMSVSVRMKQLSSASRSSREKTTSSVAMEAWYPTPMVRESPVAR